MKMPSAWQPRSGVMLCREIGDVKGARDYCGTSDAFQNRGRAFERQVVDLESMVVAAATATAEG